MSGVDHVLSCVTDRLVERGIPFRLIGAAALATHGVLRSTQDIDLLVADTTVLDEEMWRDVVPKGFSLEVRRGDATDPLVGVVRIVEDLADDADWDQVPGSLDVVVLPPTWAESMMEAEGPVAQLGCASVQAVSLVDLILLKLYAGGPRDCWDITALLEAGSDRVATVARVEARLGALPRRCERLWRRILDQLQP